MLVIQCYLTNKEQTVSKYSINLKHFVKMKTKINHLYEICLTFNSMNLTDDRLLLRESMFDRHNFIMFTALHMNTCLFETKGK